MSDRRRDRTKTHVIRDVRWAVHGKEPGTFADYDVVADSTGGLDRTELNAAVTAMIPGTPSRTVGHPDSLPWIIAGTARVRSPGDRLSVAVMSWPETPVGDAHGRPIVSTTYVDLDYAECATVRPGYTELYQAARDLPYHDGPSGPFRLRSASALAIASWIQAHRAYAWVSTVAASLLQAPVALLGTPPTTEESGALELDRLKVLDAICSLLPWGVRADLLVATWLRRGDDPAVNIGFGDETVGRQRLVFRLEELGAARPSSGGPPAGPAQQYKEALDQEAREFALAVVIENLLRRSAPIRLDQPAVVLAGLADFGRERELLSARPSLETARWALDGYSPEFLTATYEPAVQHGIFSSALRSHDPEDLDRLVHFAVVPACWDLAVATVLDETEPRPVVDVYQRAGHLWPFLATAVAQGARRWNQAAIRERLLAVLGACRPYSAPLDATPDLSPDVLRSALAAHEDVARDLFEWLAGQADTLPEWVTWYGDAVRTGDWFVPYAAAALPRLPVSSKQLSRTDPRQLSVLLRMARRLDRVDNFLPSAFASVLALARTDPMAFADTGLLSWDGPNLSTRAAIDVLATVAAPRSAFVHTGLPPLAAVPEYARVAADCLAALPRGERAASLDAFVDIIIDPARSSDVGHGKAVLSAVAERLSTADRDAVVAATRMRTDEDGQ